MPAATPVNQSVRSSANGFIARRGVAVWLLLVVAVLLQLPAQSTYAGRVVVTDETGERRELYSNSYALLIGVSDYTNGWEDLDQVPSELDKARTALEAHGFDVTMLTENTSMQELKNAIDEFIRRYGHNENNRLVFIYSGHGHTWSAGNQGYLVPSDAPVPDTEEGNPGEEFRANTLHISQMMEWARQMTARHVLFLFDSCFSGMVFKTRGTEPRSKRKAFKWRTNSQPSRQFITAGSAREKVPARSVFMPAFINAITTDEADYSEDGYLTGEELGIYLETVVPRYADQTPQYGTHPSWELSRGNFVFVLNDNDADARTVTDAPVDNGENTAAAQPDTQTEEVAKVSVREPQQKEVDTAPVAGESSEESKPMSLLDKLRLRQKKKKEEREQEQRVLAKQEALENLAREKLAREQLAEKKREQARVAQEKREQKRIAEEKREQERIAQEKREQERIVEEKREQERITEEKREQERIAQEKREQERIAEEKREQEKQEQEQLAKVEREQEQLDSQKPEQDLVAQQKREQEQLAQQRKEQERLAQAKQEQERIAQEKREQEKLAQQKTEQDRVARERQERQERLERERLQQQRKLAQDREKANNAQQRKASEQKVEQVLAQAQAPSSDAGVVVAAVEPRPKSEGRAKACAKVTPDRADYFDQTRLSIAGEEISVYQQPNHACKSPHQIARGDGVVLLARHNQWVHLRSKETGNTGWVHQQTLNKTLSDGVVTRNPGDSEKTERTGSRVPLWSWLKSKVVDGDDSGNAQPAEIASAPAAEVSPSAQVSSSAEVSPSDVAVSSTDVVPAEVAVSADDVALAGQIAQRSQPASSQVAVVAQDEFTLVSERTIDCEVESPGSADYHPQPQQYTTVSSVEMFQSPNAQCRSFAQVDKSQGVILLASKGGWVHLRDMSSGKRGWVSANALYSTDGGK